jgi:hypothetical protein
MRSTGTLALASSMNGGVDQAVGQQVELVRGVQALRDTVDGIGIDEHGTQHRDLGFLAVGRYAFQCRLFHGVIVSRL